jgi:hypothetical protein
LFWLTLVIALALGWWLSEPARRPSLAWFRKPLPVKPYFVEDIAYPMKGPSGESIWDSASLVKELRTNVTPGDWESAGGRATVAAWESGCTLIVSHSDEGHRRVAEYLDAKRAKAIADD